MKVSDTKLLELLAYEAFLRRAAAVDRPFMLKGSFVTRQYFADPGDRIPNDLDWVYLHKLDDVEVAREIFNKWAAEVTEEHKFDNVKFMSFRENSFWRMIDYAMSDDFPTVNTDLFCWVDNQPFDGLSLDISFNLEIDSPPVPLLYKPLRGEPFTIPKTVPLSTQVAWKLHQTMVRPRFKDIFDLTHLLKHQDFDEQALRSAIQTLVNECHHDKVDINLLKWMINGNLKKLFPNDSMQSTWNHWTQNGERSFGSITDYDRARFITDPDNIPNDLDRFDTDFRTTLIKAGFTPDLLENLPQPANRSGL